ncbi:hypothetical protein [Microbulbifer hainanensis]|uniref:hypothetical protein n=1 Tax=Microbulbifer hainanensis TaxID=2735675 RepID=UPI001866D326|nr:hypothetical protein [Microbulbifer hainanensis]
MYKKALIISMAATLSAAALSVSAATQGTAGTSNSSGTIGITLNVPTQIIAKGFQDIPLTTTGAVSGDPISGFTDFCVGGIGFGQYSVQLTSANGATGGVGAGSDDFDLYGTSQYLPYSASFINNTSDTTGLPADSSGDVAGSFNRVGNLGCATDNARVIVAIASADWEAATETNYSDTLTVTVTAN